MKTNFTPALKLASFSAPAKQLFQTKMAHAPALALLQSDATYEAGKALKGFFQAPAKKTTDKSDYGNTIIAGMNIGNAISAIRCLKDGMYTTRGSKISAPLIAAGTLAFVGYHLYNSSRADAENKDGFRLSDNYYVGRNTMISGGAFLASAAASAFALSFKPKTIPMSASIGALSGLIAAGIGAFASESTYRAIFN